MSSHATLSPARIASLLLPPLLVMGVIFFLSAQTERPVDRAWWDVVLRKLGARHRVRGADRCCWWRALRGPRRRGAPLRASRWRSASRYAVTDEFHQTFVDGRNGTPVDVLIDSVGIAIAARRDRGPARYARRRIRGPSRPRAA